MEETKEKKAKTGDQKRRHYNRRRKKTSDGNQQNANNNSQQKSLANGGYTKQNQNPNTEKTGGNSGNAGGSGRNRRNSHRSGRNNSENKNFSREREPKKQAGYQPDSGKDAIRSFDLGTCEDEGKLMVFHFDKGTYSIAERKVIETTTDEEGKETVRYEDTEISSTRDKTAAYKAWNEIKRPKKGKTSRDKEKKEDTES